MFCTMNEYCPDNDPTEQQSQATPKRSEALIPDRYHKFYRPMHSLFAVIYGILNLEFRIMLRALKVIVSEDSENYSARVAIFKRGLRVSLTFHFVSGSISTSFLDLSVASCMSPLSTLLAFLSRSSLAAFSF